MYIWVAYFLLELMGMPFFAAFMIFIILWYEGDGEASFIPSVYMGACWNGFGPHPVSRWQSILLEMKWICYYLKAPYPEKKRKRKKKKRNVCMKFLQRRMPVYFTCFCCYPSRTWAFPILHVWLSLSLSGQLEHLQTWRWFFLLRHEVAVPWIPTCGPPYPSMRETWCSSQK